ncbi:MAG TPA: AI-2E family transporter [Chitinophagaceae bacterium]|nr:AI-2E family transporter [Chitinophagaceae bacterium]
MPTNTILRYASILVLLIAIVFILFHLKVILVPIFFSIVFSVMLFPLAHRMEQAGIGRAASSFIAVAIMTIIFAALFFMLFRQLGNLLQEGPVLIGKMSVLLDKFETLIADTFYIRKSVTAEHVNKQLDNMMQNSGNIFTDLIGMITSFVAGAVIIPLFVFFLIYYRDFFLEFFYKLFPSSDKNWIDETLEKIYFVIQNYLLGVVIVMGIVGVLNSLGLYILGVKYAFFFGFFAALLMLIPYIGIMIGALLPALMALVTKDQYWYAVGAIGVMLFVQILEGNFITPYIVGSKVSINPLIIIFMFLLFGKLWGIPGLVLALPVTAIMKVLLETIPSCKAYSFILGEPQQYHLKKFSRLHVRLEERKAQREKNSIVS